jgi:hypothetical protein
MDAHDRLFCDVWVDPGILPEGLQLAVRMSLAFSIRLR